MARLTIGTRGSDLALWQARHVQGLLRDRFPDEEFPIEIIKTTGDRLREGPLYRYEDKGFFTKEIEGALFRGEIDIAVHSLKDLPTESPEGLVVGAIPARENPHDVWLSRDGKGPREIAPGARVGTASLRRQAQLRALRPDLVLENLRGNVPTRVQKLGAGELDAIVIARAGVDRLGLLPGNAFEIPFEWMLPAPGQGALGVQIRSDDEAVAERVTALDDREVRLTVSAERAFLARLQGGCLVPVGAHAELRGDTLSLDGMVADLSGNPLFRGVREGTVSTVEEASLIGATLAVDLLERGAGPVLERVRAFLRREQGAGSEPSGPSPATD